MIFFIFESFLGILDKKASLKQVFSCHSRDHSATTPRPLCDQYAPSQVGLGPIAFPLFVRYLSGPDRNNPAEV